MNVKNKRTASKSSSARENAFTFVELLVVIGVLTFCAILILPTMAGTRNGSTLSQCQNNLKQLAAAWTMYSADNQGVLVSAYPEFGGFSASWCKGNAATGGGGGAYTYGGADVRGITNGLLWPYVKSFSPYKCPLDNRLSLPGNPFPGQPILRSVSMNSFMRGTSHGVNPVWTPLLGPTSPRNPLQPIFIKESEISRPASIWVIVDEDPQGINDAMFIVSMDPIRRFLDLPSRLHSNGYGINFADGHTEHIKLKDPESLTWVPGQTGGMNDWRYLTNITTTPLN